MSVATRYRIHHATTYEYTADVVHAHHLLHLQPRAMAHQSCSAYSIRIEPTPSLENAGSDAFGNPVTRLELNRPHRRFAVAVDMVVEVAPRHPPAEHQGDSWERARNRLAYVARPPGNDKLEALRYRSESPHVRIKQVFTEYAADCFTGGRTILQAAEALMRKLHAEMTYVPGATSVNTSVLDVLRTKRGVCQDYAHLMIACLRSRGLAARYVSGYLRTVPRTGEARLLGADASHAWVAVWCPRAGWVEFDPTNGVYAGTDHVALAWARDFGDVSPLRGVILGGGQHTLKVAVSVERAAEA